MKKVDISQDAPTSNIAKKKQYNRDNYDNVENYYTKNKILANTSVMTRSSDVNLRHDLIKAFDSKIMNFYLNY